MVPELEKPQVTEIQVRMDCNGCVQKIKKALHGINGIYEVHIDFPQQKLTVVGWVDPQKIIKAIKKTRKRATICAHTVQTEPAVQSTEPEAALENGLPASNATNLPTESPPAEAAPPVEPPKDPPPPENPPLGVAQSSVAIETTGGHTHHPFGPKDVEEVHVVYRHPPDYNYGYSYGHSYGGNWNNYPNSHGFQHQPPPPVYVTHSYNTYKPSHYISEYEPPPQQIHYSRPEHYYSEDYHNHSNGNSNGNNITSMFSDENPNACRIV
ncbi:hypothetical protein HHK36_022988 [Tetracentron sinense]|uniref:HMA domain-containing protein n=1 Tax=Tetracentron sinense TaxID=13715 RepID=A0A834YNR9_TETSI|nr:hypothetical protein HHK36_022988 [Tetracentron sinense]